MAEDHTPTTDMPTPCIGLRAREAAKAIGISERKLSDITGDPRRNIPHVHLDRCLIYPVRELTQWLTDQMTQQGEEDQ